MQKTVEQIFAILLPKFLAIFIKNVTSAAELSGPTGLL